ncbi:MAG: SMP-30/gluconolactonase/LRE family protein [Gammaproteobacteria bacterium]|nr:SMP-30/gluconolactonase/LRE family protein [Gammaproteobacteria bacterium]
MLNNVLKFLSYLLLIQLLIACSNTPEKPVDFVFYPPLPDTPRIQYLTSYSGPDDLIEEKSAFNAFILGADEKRNPGVTKPYGVSIKDGVIYVVDIRNSGFATFDLKQKKFDIVHGSFDGRMIKPINIFVDNDNNKFVTDIKRNIVIVFDKNNEFLKTIGDSKSFKPSDVLVVDEKVFISDVKNHAIQVYDKNTTEKLYTIDGKDSNENGILYYPTNIALSPNNHLYVSATMNFNIQEFTLEGKFIRSIGQIGDKHGQFTRPKGINVDNDGNIYVVDASFQNVQIFNKDGEILMYFGEQGNASHNINLPAKVFIDYDNVSYFQKYAKPGFKLEYIILVTSQFGKSKLNVYGFGQMQNINTDNKSSIVESDVAVQ